MNVPITCKFKKDWINSNREKVVTSFFFDVQGKLTLYSVVESGEIHSSKLLGMCSLLASMKRIQSKIAEKM